MQYRLAQVVYTLTQFGTVRSVVFQIEGETVTVFGSEGIVLDGPVGARRLRRPAAGDLRGPAGLRRRARATPGRSSGTRTSSRRPSGSRSSTPPARRSSTGRSWPPAGPAAAAPSTSRSQYTVAKAQWGTLRVYNPSAKDGSPEDVRDYPVWLTPGG